jgi:hypothetical protein
MRLAVLALCSLAVPALAQQPPPNVSLGRLVVLAVKCGKRPDTWGQRLDVALGDALKDTSGEDGLRDLAETEVNAVHEWEANAAKACAAVTDGPELQQADKLASP